MTSTVQLTLRPFRIVSSSSRIPYCFVSLHITPLNWTALLMPHPSGKLFCHLSKPKILQKAFLKLPRVQHPLTLPESPTTGPFSPICQLLTSLYPSLG